MSSNGTSFSSKQQQQQRIPASSLPKTTSATTTPSRIGRTSQRASSLPLRSNVNVQQRKFSSSSSFSNPSRRSRKNNHHRPRHHGSSTNNNNNNNDTKKRLRFMSNKNYSPSLMVGLALRQKLGLLIVLLCIGVLWSNFMLIQKSSFMISDDNDKEILRNFPRYSKQKNEQPQQELSIPSKWIKKKQKSHYTNESQVQQSKPLTPPPPPKKQTSSSSSSWMTSVLKGKDENEDHSSWKQPKGNTNSNMIIIVLSDRSNFERRQLIRDTWGNQSAKHQIYFIVGRTCHIPVHQRKHELGCEVDDTPKNGAGGGGGSQREIFLHRTSTTTSRFSRLRLPKEWVEASEHLMEQEHHELNKQHTQQLEEEVNTYRDILWTDAPESYRGLPHKLKHAINWVYEHTSAQWFVKVDDDMVVRLPSLEQFLKTVEREEGKDHPTVIGDIIRDSPVAKDGKWADIDYDHWTYPPWPRGASGYVINRAVAKYVVENPKNLFISQGEDTSMGIWMDDAPFQANLISKPDAFVFKVQCYSSQALIVGHNMSPWHVKQCYQYYGNTVQDTQMTQLVQLIVGRSIEEVLMKHRKTSFPMQELFRSQLRTLMIDLSNSCTFCPYLLAYVYSLKDVSLHQSSSLFSWRSLKRTFNDLTTTAAEKQKVEDNSRQYDALVRRCVFLHWKTMKERNVTTTVSASSQLTSTQDKKNHDEKEESGSIERKVSAIQNSGIDNNSSTTIQMVDKPTPTSSLRHHPQYSLRSPRKAQNSTMIVMVLSAPENFDKRQAIRETWGEGHDNVYFVVGSPCHVPIHRRTDEYECEEDDSTTTEQELFLTKESGESVKLPSLWLRNSLKELEHQHQLENAKQHQKLQEEQQKYQDLLWIDAPESYRGLPHKLRLALAWFYQNTGNHVRWFLKLDDDMIARVRSLESYLDYYEKQSKTRSSSLPPILVGDIQRDTFVRTDGKWADPDYKNTMYPAWPRGASGYALNRVVAKYISEKSDNLFISQGEDTSMGIWMDEAPFRKDVKWFTSDVFVYDEDCSRTDHLSIGHQFTPEKLRECHYWYRDGLDDGSNSTMGARQVLTRIVVAVFFGGMLFLAIVLATAHLLLLDEVMYQGEFLSGIESYEEEEDGYDDYNMEEDERV